MRRLEASPWPQGRIASILLFGACSPAPEGSLDATRGGGPVELVLTESLEPRSGQTIDCRGGSIRPAVSADDNYGVSIPDTLIFLDHVHGVRIQNCDLDATFAIFAVGGGWHRVTGNVLRSTGDGVGLLSSDGNLVDHNTSSSSGRNVRVTGDSDDNIVWANDLSNFAGLQVDGWPGDTFAWEGDRSGIGAGTYNYPGLANLVVNGRLVQDATTTDTFADGNTFVGNDIHMDHGFAGTILATRSRNGLGTGNDISGVEIGLGIFGYDDGTWWSNPGRCSDDPSLRCGAWGPVDPSWNLDDTCDLPVVGDQGTCVGWSIVEGGGRVRSPSYVGNHVSGAVFGASSGLPTDYRFLANDVEDSEFGVALDSYSLQDGTVRGNIARGNTFGLALADYDNVLGAGEFGVDVSYNDFGDNVVGFDAILVLLGPDWEFDGIAPFALEANLPHNWWGDDCGIPESPMWPATTAEPAAAEPIAAAWRTGRAGTVPRCP